MMKVCAIICEYNPLHLGHARQMAEARRLSGADYLLCLMSGPFVQRGEPAILDKWTRAKTALAAGADMVMELPSLFALRAAQDFAYGAVSLLDALGAVTHLSFGSELDDLDALWRHALPETDYESVLINHALSEGHSYPRAVALASGKPLPPNALLAVEYLRALRRINSSIQPVVVRRDAPHGGEGSSSAVRRLLAVDPELAWAACPPSCSALSSEALAAQGGPAQLDRLEPLALALLRRMGARAISAYPGMTEGLENRFFRCAQQACSLDEFFALLKTKRYTMARLKRSLLHILLQNTQECLVAHPRAEYARVLGFRGDTLPLLREIGRRSHIPLVLRPAQWQGHPMFQTDLRAQDLWGLCQNNPDFRRSNRVLDMPPMRP